ncbi:MAG: hypothetical protein MJ033_06400 [Victivallaceae bacterium]|nr:hypothetical protein [Victivallaceae bacterium]
MKFFACFFALLGITAVAGETLFETEFSPGWDKTKWEMVRSWRFDSDGVFLQNGDSIENRVPEDATPREMRNQRAGETYAAMLLKTPFSGGADIGCTMEFTDRMAPGIVIAADPVVNTKGKLEFREHYEVILYDDGLNVWHHRFVGGRQTWTLAAHLTKHLLFKPDTRYRLAVKIQPQKNGKGAAVTVTCNGECFGYTEENFFSGSYRIGIVAGEGINRFYDFKVNRL